MNLGAPCLDLAHGKAQSFSQHILPSTSPVATRPESQDGSYDFSRHADFSGVIPLLTSKNQLFSHVKPVILPEPSNHQDLQGMERSMSDLAEIGARGTDRRQGPLVRVGNYSASECLEAIRR